MNCFKLQKQILTDFEKSITRGKLFGWRIITDDLHPDRPWIYVCDTSGAVLYPIFRTQLALDCININPPMKGAGLFSQITTCRPYRVTKEYAQGENAKDIYMKLVEECGDGHVWINKKYYDIFKEGDEEIDFYSNGVKSPVYVLYKGEIFGLIMPVRR